MTVTFRAIGETHSIQFFAHPEGGVIQTRSKGVLSQ